MDRVLGLVENNGAHWSLLAQEAALVPLRFPFSQNYLQQLKRDCKNQDNLHSVGVLGKLKFCAQRPKVL